jgi:hypothetical protein
MAQHFVCKINPAAPPVWSNEVEQCARLHAAAVMAAIAAGRLASDWLVG